MALGTGSALIFAFFCWWFQPLVASSSQASKPTFGPWADAASVVSRCGTSNETNTTSPCVLSLQWKTSQLTSLAKQPDDALASDKLPDMIDVADLRLMIPDSHDFLFYCMYSLAIAVENVNKSTHAQAVHQIADQCLQYSTKTLPGSESARASSIAVLMRQYGLYDGFERWKVYFERDLEACWQAHRGGKSHTNYLECVPDHWENDFDVWQQRVHSRLGILVDARVIPFLLWFSSVVFIFYPMWQVRAGVLWVLFSLVFVSLHWLSAAYQFVRIAILAFSLFWIKLVFVIHKQWERISSLFGSRVIKLKKRLVENATSYDEWKKYAMEVDELTEAGKCTRYKTMDIGLLMKNIVNLNGLMSQGAGRSPQRDIEELAQVLQAILKRNHGGIDEWNVHLEGPGQLVNRPPQIVTKYSDRVTAALNYYRDNPHIPLKEKMQFFHFVRLAYGATALCLSGGGSLAMYHLGVCKELLQNGLLPNVISGTSGGSIVCGVLAIFNDKELLDDIIQPDISTRFKERWFPAAHKELWNFLREGVLMKSCEFEACAKRYYGDTTFEEAYRRTGRQCNITITAGGAARRSYLLVNRITAPNVTIASAVCASCALPGIMKGCQLKAKTKNGDIVVYNSGGEQWIDGSLNADIPKNRLAELFHVNTYIVSQVNPHIAPFLHVTRKGQSGMMSQLQYMRDWIVADFQHRCRKLSKLKAMPALFGHIEPIIKQQYGEYQSGCTVIPKIQVQDTLKALQNPTKQDMVRYIYEGQRCTWEHMEFVKHLRKIEQEVLKCYLNVREEYNRRNENSPSHEPQNESFGHHSF